MMIMKGDSYPLYFELTLDGITLTPDMVAEMEVCMGESIRKLYSDKGVQFDNEMGMWYFWPTQEETLAMPDGQYHVVVRVRYKNPGMKEVQGCNIGRIVVMDTFSNEVI